MFASHEVKYLGFVVTKDGVMLDKDKTKAISELEFPKTQKALNRFLCSINYYRDFITG